MIDERTDQNDEGNFYEDEADYYYNSALKISTKTGIINLFQILEQLELKESQFRN